MADRCREMWDKRELFELAPPRYSEVSSIPSVRKLFISLAEKWRTEREQLNYADLGSGDCRGTRVFADFLRNCTHMPVNTVAVDGSAQCEVSCKKQGMGFLRLDLGSDEIPLMDCQVVTLFETIEHVFDTDHLLQTTRKAISKDGILLVTTLNVVCWKNRIMVPLGIQPFNTEVSTKKLSYGCRFESLKKRMDTWKPAGHIRPFTLYSLCEMLEDNGFKVVRSYGLENWRAFKFLEHLAKNMCTGILVLAKPR